MESIPQYKKIGRLAIKLNVEILQLFVVALFHHYFTLQIFIYLKTSLCIHLLVVCGHLSLFVGLFYKSQPSIMCVFL